MALLNHYNSWRIFEGGGGFDFGGGDDDDDDDSFGRDITSGL